MVTLRVVFYFFCPEMHLDKIRACCKNENVSLYPHYYYYCRVMDPFHEEIILADYVHEEPPSSTFEGDQSSRKIVTSTFCFPEILKSFQSDPDVQIICNANRLVQTSSLLLVMCSDYLKDILVDVVSRENEKLHVFLDDFRVEVVQAMISYVTDGWVSCRSTEDLEQLGILLKVLELKGHADDDIRWSNAARRRQETSFPAVTSESISVKVEPAEASLVITELPTANSPTTVKVKKGVKRPLPENDAEEDEAHLDGDDDTPSTSNPGTCDCCGFEANNLDVALKHILDTIGAVNTTIPGAPTRKNGSRLCPICHKVRGTELSMIQHLKVHMSEAHNQRTTCDRCKEQFENV